MRNIWLLAVLAVLVALPARAQRAFGPPLASGEDVRFYIETTEAFSVMCDFARALTSAATPRARLLKGVGSTTTDLPTGELATSSIVTSLYDCSCASCCVVVFIDPSSCASSPCVSGNAYQVVAPATPTVGGGTMNCNVRADLFDVKFKVK